MNQTTLDRLEKKNPNMLFTPSDDGTIVYVTSKDDDRIGVVTIEGGQPTQKILLTHEQAYAICQELPEMTWMIGRGRYRDPRGGKRRDEWAT